MPIRQSVLASVLISGVLIAIPAVAKWSMGTEMPVERLIKNTNDYIKLHPKDATGYYTLGRIQSAAFAMHTDKLHSYNGDKPNSLPQVVPGYPQHSQQRENKFAVSSADIKLLEASINNYKTATDLAPTNGAATFGLGFECEEALRFPTVFAALKMTLVKTTAAVGPGVVAKETVRQYALKSYRAAFNLSINEDMKPTLSRELISQEAAEGIIRLQANITLNRTDQAEIETLKSKIKDLQGVARPFTPILIDLHNRSDHSALISKTKIVRFDLSGQNANQKWPWVTPDTGILVWDPHQTGKITSGLQLFGSVTWWLFWNDGYGPLAALDDNHDGWLKGAELKGICVWFDRNGNGISDTGEVVSLSSIGIKGIAVSSRGVSGGAPYNSNGVQLTNGKYATSYDWIPKPIN